MLSEEFSSLARKCEPTIPWTRRRNAFFRLFDTGHRHGRGARGVWLRAVSPFAAGLTASEQAIARPK